MMGVTFDAFTYESLIKYLVCESLAGRGGYAVPVNVDVLRQAAEDSTVRALIADAQVTVADGLPLVWASRLQSTPLAGRVAGSDLVLPLTSALIAQKLRVYMVGGASQEVVDGAADALRSHNPELAMAGSTCPPFGFSEQPDGYAALADQVLASSPDFVYIGLPLEMSARLAAMIVARDPSVWCLSVGVSFSFISGHVKRAPLWMRRTGLEWAYRLSQEPSRLARRYLLKDPPIALRLLGTSITARIRKSTSAWHSEGGFVRPLNHRTTEGSGLSSLPDSASAAPLGRTSLTVYHFGPKRDEVGGMATVIDNLTQNHLGADHAYAVPTWSMKSHFSTLKLFAHALNQLRTLPERSVVHVHLSENGSFLREGLVLIEARRRNFRTVATLHGSHYDRFSSRYPALARHVLTACDYVTCLSADQASAVASSLPKTRVAFLPNPVDIPSRVLPLQETGPIVLFLGEIGRRKGADVLHQAWRNITLIRPDARCIMVGPATSLYLAPLPQLTILPPQPHTEALRLIEQARCVVLPSRAEALPMALIEAMSMARPFISTPVGGILDISAGGMIVPVGDASHLSEKILLLLDDSAFAERLGLAGQALIANERSTDTISAALRSIYSGTRTSPSSPSGLA